MWYTEYASNVDVVSTATMVQYKRQIAEIKNGDTERYFNLTSGSIGIEWELLRFSDGPHH